jgi:hypothetical protein
VRESTVLLKNDNFLPLDLPTATKLPPSGRNYGALQHFAISVADTRPHEIQIEYVQSARITGAGLSFEWTPSSELLKKQTSSRPRLQRFLENSIRPGL